MPDLTLRYEDINTNDGPFVIVAAGAQDREVFSVPANHVDGRHSHVRGQLIGSMRGLLSVGVAGGFWIVPTIHAVWLPPHHVHSVSSHGPFEGWSAYIAEPACRTLPDKPCTIRTSALLREAVLRASSWTLGPLDRAQSRVAQVIIDEVAALPVEAFGLPLPVDPRLVRIAKALIADPANGRDLDAWAAWGALSSRTLSRRFVVETGFTFTAWRQRVRLLRSLEMLAAAMPVATIALDLGYSSASAFIGLFKRTFGATPACYRLRL